MAGKQSQANKNFWYAYALWQQKVAQALARRRAEELARKRAEAEARARQAQSSSQSRAVNPYPLALFLAVVIFGVGGLLGTVQTKSSKNTPDFRKETVEESQGATRACYEATRAIPSFFDDMLCPLISVVDNFNDVGRLANDIAEGLIRIITGSTTSASQLEQLQQENILGFNLTTLYDVSDDTTTTAESEEEDESQYIILYHYTKAENIPSILSNGLRPSIQDPNNPNQTDAHQGNGQYFTDLTPEESSTVTRGQHSAALFVTQWQWGGRPPLSDIGWIAFSIPQQNVQRAAPLYGPRFPHRSIYLYPNSYTLLIPIMNVVGTGIITFQPGPAGNR